MSFPDRSRPESRGNSAIASSEFVLEFSQALLETGKNLHTSRVCVSIQTSRRILTLPVIYLLTYMATVAQAVASGTLEIFELPAWEKRLPIRPLYVARKFFDWVENKPELHDADREIGGRLLVDHLEQIFCDFRCAERPGAGDLRRMMPTKYGIWKLHPQGLRVYGWCPATHTFVAVEGALVAETKADGKFNDTKLKAVRDFTKAHGLQGTILRGDIRAIFP